MINEKLNMKKKIKKNKKKNLEENINNLSNKIENKLTELKKMENIKIELKYKKIIRYMISKEKDLKNIKFMILEIIEKEDFKLLSTEKESK